MVVVAGAGVTTTAAAEAGVIALPATIRLDGYRGEEEERERRKKLVLHYLELELYFPIRSLAPTPPAPPRPTPLLYRHDGGSPKDEESWENRGRT